MLNPITSPDMICTTTPPCRACVITKKIKEAEQKQDHQEVERLLHELNEETKK